MLEEIYSETEAGMQKSLDSLKSHYGTLRTGKVSTSILDNIMVPYYDVPTALSQVATVLATDATTIAITPWEKHIVGDIEKAINEANIGVNPNNDGESVKLFFPPMTVEQREKTAKEAKAMTEDAKVSIRNVRKNANDKVKKLLKDKEITEDENKSAIDKVQKITDEMVAKADEIFKTKEAEILKV
jgi:ribosome recycling factor